MLVADVGRTTARVAVCDQLDPIETGTAGRVEVPSGASLADHGGIATVLAVLADATRELGRPDPDPEPCAVVVGVAGAGQHPTAAIELADALAQRAPNAAVSVTSDVITAHAGALSGEPGVVLIAGTGAVALGIAADGTHQLVDGWGWMVGDSGSGAWLGRVGLDAALRAHDGRPGGSPRVARAAAERFGPLDRLPARLHGAASPAREIAGFVPELAAAARAGDPVARDAFARAVEQLTDTVAAACRAAGPPSSASSPELALAVVGGLTALQDLVVAPLMDAVTTSHPTIRARPPAGDALAGARRLAEHGAGVHRSLVLGIPARRSRSGRHDAGRTVGTAPTSTHNQEA